MTFGFICKTSWFGDSGGFKAERTSMFWNEKAVCLVLGQRSSVLPCLFLPYV